MSRTSCQWVFGLTSIASGAAVSPMVKIEHAVRGGFLVPAAFTNVGGTNLMRFDVSNDFGDAAGTPITATLPTTTIATALTQQLAVGLWYPLPKDVFKFKYVRLNGVATEAAARDLPIWLLVDDAAAWERRDVGIVNGATVSETIDLKSAVGGSIFIPAAFTGTTLTFQVSGDGGAFNTARTVADAAISQGVLVSRWLPLPDEVLQHRYLRLVSGGTEGAARLIRLDLKFIG